MTHRNDPPYLLGRVLVLCGLWVVIPVELQAQEQASPVVVSPVAVRELRGGHRVVGTVMPARRSIVGMPSKGGCSSTLSRSEMRSWPGNRSLGSGRRPFRSR